MKLIPEMFAQTRELRDPFEARYNLLNNYLFMFSFVGHMVFIPVFYLLGGDIPFYNNLICIILDVFCLYMNSRWKLRLVYVLFSAEITYHTFFCNLIYGLSTGFIYYFFSLTVYIFLFRKYKYLRWVLFAILAALFVLQYFYIESSPPDYPSGVIPIWFVFFLNASANFIAIAFIAAQFSVFADSYERKILRAKEKAEEGERAKSVFLANMSHEIRSPLNSIIGMINLSLLSGSENKKKEYLYTAKSSADHLLTVINDILDYSKIEESRMTLHFETFDLHHLVKNTMTAMDSSIYNRDLRMEYCIREGVPGKVSGDPSRIRQVLMNLVSNAIKFTEKGSIKVTLEYISGKGDSCTVSFSVEDTGSGIPADKLGTIFDRFTQVEWKGKRSYTGTGLGLAISKELVELMGGAISVISSPGAGSIFTFRIPLELVVAEDIKIPSEKPAASGFRYLKILIAEDIFTNWLLYEKYMEVLGHSYKIVENGNMVLDELEANNYDLVLMDIEMPYMGGLEALNIIRTGTRKINMDIPVIALTGHSEENFCKMKDEFSGFVFKPVELYDLENKINEIMFGV